jgi:transcriptional regulator with XRE-family HTH domain
MSTLAERIQLRLDALGTNPGAVSDAVGTNRSLVRDILNGKSRSPSLDTIKALCGPLECSLSFLAGDDAKVQADQWDEALRGKKMSDATGRVIFKYQMPVLERFTMRLPVGAEIIRMQDQGGMFWMWAIVRTDVPDEYRHFWAFKCGGKIPDDINIKYVGFCAVFVQQELGLYIFEDMGNE